MNGTETPTVGELATQAARYFTTSTRADDTQYVHTIDGRPEWLQDLCMEAHGDMLPDDWKYTCIRDTLVYIGECTDDTDLQDAAYEFADGQVSIYTHDLCAWLASHSDRVAYCDEAANEAAGYEVVDTTARIGQGQFAEALEVWESVVSSLQARVDELSS